MKRMTLLQMNTLAFLLASLLAGASAFADKGGGDRGRRHEGNAAQDRGERGYEQRDQRGENRHEYFRDEHRAAIREYYDDRYRAGRCPPGLAKKRNGCMPPGQARKWVVGRPLPRDVIYYDLPPPVVAQIGPPPAGHRYVRVASDILLIAIGTGMIVDAIDDLNRR